MVSIPLNHSITPRRHVLIVDPLRDGVAPVGRDEPIVRVVHAERGTQAAGHATGSIRPALLLVDALDQDIVLRRVRRKLQHDLVRPFMRRVRELLVHLRALLVRPDLHLRIELPPELEVNTGHLELAYEVPCDKCVVELFCRVKSGEELWLDDDLYRVSRG